MPRHSSYRSNHGIESVGSDWSSSQLIIGIAVAVVFGLVCFAAGYVIAIKDIPLEPVAMNADDGEQTGVVPVPPAPTPVESAPAAGEVSPKAAPVPAPAAPTTPAPATAPAPEPAKAADTVQRTGLRPTAIGALPEPGGPTPMVRTPVDMNKAPAPQIEPMDPDESITVPGITPPTPTTVPAKETVASNVPAVTPPTAKEVEPVPPAEVEVKPPVKTAEVTPPATKPTEVKPPATKPAEEKGKEKDKEKEKEKSAAPTVTKGSFGIQVASFDGPQRSTQAKDFQRNLKTKAQQNADIIVAADGTYHKVVISGFDTRDAAKAACEKMKSKPGLEGAWVVRLP